MTAPTRRVKGVLITRKRQWFMIVSMRGLETPIGSTGTRSIRKRRALSPSVDYSPCGGKEGDGKRTNVGG